ncbi:uncharacterized protein [Bemisia tabaci]|uniref:uncharacterized protein n=1 Tax=Bemisia tabaci TaxID=7038 RepID=UPI003B282EE0
MSPWRAFNDYAHIELTVKWLGKFHAMSLTCKHKFPRRFNEIVAKFKETHWTKKRLQNPDAFFKENCKRGIVPLQNDPDFKEKLKDLLTVVEETDISMAKVVAPEEPLAVVCHGDFCRNNVFYKYDSNDKPLEIMFFDFATSRYSSPVIDLSFYLFMNSSPNFKADHWNDVLRTYHTALTSNFDLSPVEPPSFENIQLDVRRRGFYGYTFAAFFLPAMFEDDWTKMEYREMTIPEIIERQLTYGGEVGTEYVKQLVKFMIEHNFDFKYILNLKLDAFK